MKMTPFLFAPVLFVLLLMNIACEPENDLPVQRQAEADITETSSSLHTDEASVFGIFRNHSLYDSLLNAVMVAVHVEEQDRLLNLSLGEQINFYEHIAKTKDADIVIPTFTGITVPGDWQEQLAEIQELLNGIRDDMPHYGEDAFIRDLSATVSDDIVNNQCVYPPEIANATPCFYAYREARAAAYNRLFVSTSFLTRLGNYGAAAALSILAWDLFRASMAFCDCIFRTYGEIVCP